MVTNVIAIIAILVTVSGAAWYKTLKDVRHETQKSPEALVRDQKLPPLYEGGEKVGTTSLTLSAWPNAILVDTQESGNTVTINTVVLEYPGFIAIHELNAGKPAKIVSFSKLLPAGTIFNLEIALGRETIDGEKFVAMLHLDDGNKKFDAIKDKPAKDIEGNPITAQFEISKGILQ